MTTAGERYAKFASGVAFVLVEPATDGNVGAAARAMANFGFHRLRLVSPSANHLSGEARAMAASAAGLLEAAEVFPTLEAALSDVRHAFGTTRRTGRRRRAMLAPEEMGRMLLTIPPEEGAAIVFGPERTGLSAEHLELCNATVTIQTHSEYNSLNLAQAVLLMSYEAHGAFLGSSPSCAAMPDRVNALASAAEEILRAAGFVTGSDAAQVQLRIRRLLMRGRPTADEARLLHAAMMEVRTAITGKRGRG